MAEESSKEGNEEQSTEDLQAKITELEERDKKRSDSYTALEKEKNQLLHGFSNLSGQLEQEGIGKVSINEGKVRVELDKKDDGIQKSEIDVLNDKKNKLKIQRKDMDIDDDDYIDQMSDINAEIKTIQRMDKQRTTDNEAAEANKVKSTQTEWQDKIRKDFPDAAQTGSDLLAEMGKLAKPGIDYEGDMSRYYELAERANERLNPEKGKQNMDDSGDYGSLKNNSTGSNSHQQQSSAEALSPSDKKYIEVNIGGEQAKKIEKILQANRKLGTVIDGDEFLTNSRVHLSTS